MILKDWLLYVAAAFFEIFGCYAFWLVYKEGKNLAWILLGVASLLAFAWVLTRVEGDFAGRAYAAYGGVYIFASLFWLIGVEKATLTRWDGIGALLSVIGAIVIMVGNLKNNPL